MRATWWISSLGLIAAALLLVQLPVLVIEPGPTFPVSRLVDVPDASFEQPDSMLVTSVQVDPTTAVGWVQAIASPAESVVPAVAVTPPGVEPEEFVEQQQQVFVESIRVSAAVGLRAAGREVAVSGEGVRVQAVVPGSPASDVLQQGDQIVAVDGDEVDLASELVAATTASEVGDELQLTIIRGGSEQQVSVVIAQLPLIDQVGIGIFVQTINQQIELPIDVEVAEGTGLAGPSGGLMMALGFYDAFSDVDLTDGRVIAGTGAMDPSGRVGAVSGIAEKVRAAIRDGADVFLVPLGEIERAREVAGSEIDVIGVETLEEAIIALES